MRPFLAWAIGFGNRLCVFRRFFDQSGRAAIASLHCGRQSSWLPVAGQFVNWIKAKKNKARSLVLEVSRDP